MAINVIRQTAKYTNIYGTPPNAAEGFATLEINNVPKKYVVGIIGSIIGTNSRALSPINIIIIPVR
jgi:hypothetical protein